MFSHSIGFLLMQPRAYLETTIASYLTARPSRDLITAANQQMTHDWWHDQRGNFDLYVSQFVIEEASAGDPEAATRLYPARTPGGVALWHVILSLTRSVNSEMPMLNAFTTTLRQSVMICGPGKHNVAEKWCPCPRSLCKPS